MTRPLADWALLLALALLWGSAFAFQDVAVDSVGPVTATAIRLVLSALILAGALRLTLRRLPASPRLWGWLAAMAVIGNVAPFALTTWAQERVESNLAGILTSTAPLITLALAHFFMPGERLNWRRMLGFALGFCGVGVLLGPQIDAPKGDLLAFAALLGAACCYAGAAVIAARMPDLPALAAATGVLLAAALVAAPAAFYFEDPMRAAPPSAVGLAALLALGLAVTAGGTWAYFRLARRAGPSFLSLFNYLTPVVAMACGALFLGEELSPGAAPALLLILAGLALTS